MKEGEHRSDIVLRLPPPLSEYSVQGFVVWSDRRPAPNEYIYLQDYWKKERRPESKLFRPTSAGILHEGLRRVELQSERIPAQRVRAAPQSEWVDITQTPDAKPIKLVLPVLKK